MKQPFRFQGREVFGDVKTQTPRVVPDADPKTLDSYIVHMERLFTSHPRDRNRSCRLPAMIYKGVAYPTRNIGEFIEVDV